MDLAERIRELPPRGETASCWDRLTRAFAALAYRVIGSLEGIAVAFRNM